MFSSSQTGMHGSGPHVAVREGQQALSQQGSGGTSG